MTKKTLPASGQSAVARYATNGATFAGSNLSNPSSSASASRAASRSAWPGMVAVSRVRAAGQMALTRTPY